MKYVVEINKIHHFLSGKAKSFFSDIEEKDPKEWNNLKGFEVSKIVERCLEKMPIVSDDYSDKIIGNIKIFLMSIQRALTYVPMVSKIKSYVLLDDPFKNYESEVKDEFSQISNFAKLLTSNDYLEIYKINILEILCNYETANELHKAINNLNKMIELKKMQHAKVNNYIGRSTKKCEDSVSAFLSRSTKPESKKDYDVFENGMLSQKEVIGFYKGQAIHYIANFKDNVNDLLETGYLINRLIKFQFSEEK